MSCTFLSIEKWQGTNDNNYYVVGPFKVKANEDNPTYVDPETYDIKLSVENYEIFEDRECTKKIEKNINDILDEEYFVKVPTNTNINKLSLNITCVRSANFLNSGEFIIIGIKMSVFNTA